MAKNLVEFRNLKTFFYTEEGVVKAVNDVSFSIREGETVCIVGESGCGKSVTALSLMRLIQSPPGKIEGGEIIFDGRDILKLSEAEMRRIRGNEIGMIFQEPMTSLNPVLTIGEQIMEPLIVHKLMTKKEAWNKAIELIKQVGIPRAEQIMTSYPHELSGGMRQRIMIAIALSCDPKLLIADEPTTALDVTIQAQILDLLRKIKQERNMALMLITHDLGIVAEIADYVVVMYAGKVIEEAPVRELFKNPKHPYTRGLLKAKPIIGQRQERLYTIPGQVPNPIGLGDYCYFSDRCEYAMDICRQKIPQLAADENGHKVACWLYEGEWKK
ncbi:MULTISPECIES: ABC transporter ATP-binding protein [Thermoanaerobacter]|uniref:Oligopeptide/dipeptide ABC transporter, ATPase subunit n=2 Tax=Thermoanaerobacter TaxID=1754 RepID=B0KBJ3_THEP3|nr:MULTISPECIES: ABC transporter ATP-binding protein [Thermoanaerobacter]ABY93872.1 oligopeptide/dipeptide ABC transporter, ATPase subunit [Thermoanaerobacter pseudethanolicus ATCC 33223]ADV78833.1 oligopeptide/dipeptide ABC transporter, ATPase subunit [Thermoanaerobacter brockii subsp. finnii Ako-1]HBW59638.1 ABC transporter ATP-binding protein [Thermoanaerobacter sp.]